MAAEVIASSPVEPTKRPSNVNGTMRAVEDLREVGNAHMAKGSWAKAIRCYTKAIEMDEENALLYSNRSAARFFMKQYKESLEDAEMVVQLDPKWWKGYKRKGLSLVHLQRYDDAMDVFERALKLEPDNTELQRGLQFAKTCLEQAQNLYVLPAPEMMQRLDGIPVFIVTDNKGQPFFITYEDGQQVCTFYFQYSDAVSTLDWIKKENPALGKTASVVAISLSQAFQLAQDTQQNYQGEQPKEKSNPATAEDSKPTSTENLAEKAEKSVETADEAAATGAPDADKEQQQDSQADDLDPDVPLAFQFRPELRQVEVAVELLNNPDLKKVVKIKTTDGESTDATKDTTDAGTEAIRDAQDELQKTEGADRSEENKVDGAEIAEDAEKTEENVPESVQGEETKQSTESRGETDKPEISVPESKTETGAGGDEEEVELTVDNFNGIPIFQARGLTLLQNNKHYIPLFFSKWDLDDAWKQLNQVTAAGVPDETEIDVGTLEDVLRRMVEGDSKEFENVIFVPTRESLKHVGREFPLDDLTNSAFGRTPPRSNAFQTAKQIAAAGGSQEAIREAIRLELVQRLDKNQYSDLLSRIMKPQELAAAAGASGAAPTATAAPAPKSRPPQVSKAVASKVAVKPKKKKGTDLRERFAGSAAPAAESTNAAAVTEIPVDSKTTGESIAESL